MSRPEHVIVDELDPKEKGLTIGDYLKDNYRNKTIGKEAVPYIKPIVDSIGSAYTDTMRDARHGLLGPHSFVGAHALNLAGKIIPDIPIDKGIKHALHEWGGVDEYLSGVAGEGAEIALTRKVLNKVSKLKPKDLGITTKTEKINTLSRGKKMWNITDQIDEIIVKAHPSYIRKASELYKHHEGGITWKQAMEMAKLPSWENRTVYIPPNERIGTQKGDPLQSVGDGGFTERLGKKIFQKKTEQPNIFTDTTSGRALPGMAGFKASMDNDIEAFAMDLFAKGKSGYKSLGAFRAKVINKLSDKDKYQILAEGDNLKNGYIEHMIQKSSSMNWYWKMKNQDRDGLQNVRMSFDTRLKTLKDIAEGVVHGIKLPNGKFKKGLGWQTNTLENRIIVSFEDPDKHSFVFNKTGLGNIVLRRAGSNKLIGKLGQYLTSLYPQDPNIKAELDSNISNYIAENKLGVTVSDWKRKFLENRVQLIIDEAPGLSGMNEAERNRFIDDEINKDMIQLRQEFTWLPQEQTNPLTEVEAGSDVFDYDKQPSGIPELGSKPVQGGPFKDFSEQDTTKIKGTGRVNQKSLFDQISDIIDHKE